MTCCENRFEALRLTSFVPFESLLLKVPYCRKPTLGRIGSEACSFDNSHRLYEFSTSIIALANGDSFQQTLAFFLTLRIGVKNKAFPMRPLLRVSHCFEIEFVKFCDCLQDSCCSCHLCVPLFDCFVSPSEKNNSSIGLFWKTQ